ncbi:MAG: hypothetical protein M5U34_28920 [Chloroflexi bacterium]|nr:hypothetical protein [Chloroflexota bacterium]
MKYFARRFWHKLIGFGIVALGKGSRCRYPAKFLKVSSWIPVTENQKAGGAIKLANRERTMLMAIKMPKTMITFSANVRFRRLFFFLRHDNSPLLLDLSEA